ncbi:MAG: AMP-binding protein [Acetobacteraceae bacterium]
MSGGKKGLRSPPYRRARAVFGEVIGNIYGLTEAAGPVTFLLPSDMSAGKHESVGKPGKNIELAILDDCGNPTSGLETGEIGLAGPQITTGYLEKPEETRDTFAGKWFLTGDIGKIDADGFVYVVDRRKDMIKTGGFNVYPSEVEQVLYKQPEVLECAVLGMPDIKWTEAVHAAVVLRPGFTGSESHLISCCRTELGGYKVPKEVHFVPKLPRTRFGKFDKAQLRRDLSSNASDQEHD